MEYRTLSTELRCVTKLTWALLLIHVLISCEQTSMCTTYISCADPKGVGTGVPDPPPWKITKYRVSQQYWSGSPEKSKSYQASVQCWAIIGTPAKRNLNGVSLAADDGPILVVFGSTHQLKNVKVGLPLILFYIQTTTCKFSTKKKRLQ